MLMAILPVARSVTTTGTQMPTERFGPHFGAGILYVVGPDELDPKTGYEPGQKVLWYKPSDALLIVTGRGIDGAAPPLGYDISRDPRPRGPIQPSGIYFPSVGCWEVDAKAGRSELRFVVLVKSGPL